MKKPIDYVELDQTPDPTPTSDLNQTPKVGEVVNHDFETGDLTGCIIESVSDFSNQDVTDVNNCGWDGEILLAH